MFTMKAACCQNIDIVLHLKYLTYIVCVCACVEKEATHKIQHNTVTCSAISIIEASCLRQKLYIYIYIRKQSTNIKCSFDTLIQ